ncbi:ribonuclease HI family protein [Candidatus Parcubacteria bacterium]|nr:ribonuclease HI family protein [Candidatus Parcubacteria bacterium]
MKAQLIIYADGGSRGNPGPAALGVVIEPVSESGLHSARPRLAGAPARGAKEYAEYLGELTNNEAEYRALIFALKKVKQLYGKEKVRAMAVEVRMDSELVVKHLNAEYKIEDEKLQPLFLEVWNLRQDFGSVRFTAVPRAKNRRADRLANEILNQQTSRLL